MAAVAARFRPPPPPPSGVQLMVNAGLDPDPWQVDYLTNKPSRHIMVCSRQSGKSTTTAADALATAVGQPDALVLIVAPSQRQAIELLGKVRQFAFAQDPPVPMTSVAQQTLKLKNGSRIVALPGKDETIRAFSAVSLIVADEAAWIPQRVIEAVRPMLAVSHGRLVLLSTLWFTTGWFYEAWQDSEKDTSQWTRTKVTALECPRITPEFLDEERQSLSDASFRREYMCEAVEADGQVFSPESIDAAINNNLESIW
jgi:Terminase large subunit, T4likevirus-type, N-terminal